MRAIAIDRYGPPEVLRLVERPKPRLAAGGVLIRIRASVATPPDCAFRSANPFIIRLMFGLLRPRFDIVGCCFAGEVEAVGEGVTRFAVGDAVYGASDSGFGCYAEYIALAEDGVIARMPSGTAFGDAAALSEGFLTALPFLRDGANLRPGQSLAIIGASGSIGTMAVQLAKGMGAEVTAICSGRNAPLVHSLGADHVIDYTREDLGARQEAYDVIFDAVGTSSLRRMRRALKPGGVYLTTVPSLHILLPTLRFKADAKAGRKRGKLMTTGLRAASDKCADLVTLSEMIEARRLQTVIDRRYPLEEASAAHAYVETRRKRGSVVIDV